MTSDRELGMHRRITRRDILSGCAVGLTAIGARAATKDSPFPQDQPDYYPPALSGLRGSHPGSFENAHQLRDGCFWKTAGQPADTGEYYDLVVAGAGISGLAAAHFYRMRAGAQSRILILDNHDDFGGHAKRNEFRVNGRLLITYGGTMSIESPFPYSAQARGLMEQLGIDPVRLTAGAGSAATHPFRDLKRAFFFDRETFGVERLVAGVPGARSTKAAWQEFLARTPLSPELQSSIVRLETEQTDYLPGLTSGEKKDRLSRIGYKDFLLNLVKVEPGTPALYQTRTHSLFGVGIDAVNALDCWGLGYPGFQGMRLEPGATARMGFTARGEATPQQPYHFHFPDGNAAIARALVKSLVNGAAGSTAKDPAIDPKDLETAKFNYAALDRPGAPVRIRLSSTVARAHHLGPRDSAKEVEILYQREGRVYKVRSRHAVLACWNMMIPYLCPDLPEEQKQALRYGVKVPLVYTAVALRNWKSFHALGVRSVHAPGMYHSSFSLEDPVTIGGYRAAPATPEDPVIVRMLRTPCLPGRPERDQHRAGRVDLLTTSFATFERNIRDQLTRTLGPGGFDPARDIAGITVNRWPHGYAYEYNYLFDPEWPEGKQPCEIARQPFGRIAIANSDAGAAAYTDIAIDQAYRAVAELMEPPKK